eukprot:TRINITY_DN74_c0_g1_i1.p1 TRINITY_DN74_c0_g1~~TRINITY_DN74_c0_g1_i1.p1  ORF type:complete len:410 (-),score=73.55 TRINITY_DN74_c0_g1_i1:261-1490(-)
MLSSLSIEATEDLLVLAEEYPGIPEMSGSRYKLLLVVFVDLFAVGMFIPLLPQLAEQLGMQPGFYGVLGSLYGFAQLISSPAFGWISDNWGRKTVMLISCLVSVMAYGMIAIFHDVWALVLSRVIVGLGKQTISVAHAYMADVCAASDRAKFIGWVNTAMFVGLVVGPLFGGFISDRAGLRFVPIATSCFFILDSIIVVLFLPEPVFHAPRASRKHSMWPLTALLATFRLPATRYILLMQLLSAAGGMLTQSAALLEMQARFGSTTGDGGMLLALVGIIGAITQGPGLTVLTKFFQQNFLVKLGAAVALVAHILCIFTTTSFSFMLCVGLSAAGHAIVFTCLTAAMTLRSDAGQTGSVLGVSASVVAFTQAVLPLAGGLLVQVGTPSLNLVCGLLFAVLWTLAVRLSSW